MRLWRGWKKKSRGQEGDCSSGDFIDTGLNFSPGSLQVLGAREKTITLYKGKKEMYVYYAAIVTSDLDGVHRVIKEVKEEMGIPGQDLEFRIIEARYTSIPVQTVKICSKEEIPRSARLLISTLLEHRIESLAAETPCPAGWDKIEA